MKKFAITALILTITMSLSAQLPFHFGPKLGLNFNKLTTDVDEVEEKFNTGFHAGIFVRLEGSKFYFQPEALYSVRGGEFEFTQENPTQGEDTYNNTIKLQTLDIPLLLGFKLADMKVMNLRIHAGPVASYVLNKKYELDIIGSDSNDEEKKHEDELKDAIWGLQVGAGIDVMMFTLDVRYDFGLNDIYDESDDASDLPLTNLKTNTILVTLGWKIM